MYGSVGHSNPEGTGHHTEKTLNHHIEGIGAQIRQQEQGHTQMGNGQPQEQHGNPFPPQQGFLFRAAFCRMQSRRIGKLFLNVLLKGCPVRFRIIPDKFR